MSQSRMYVPRKRRFGEHRPPRVLQNEIWETASIPVRQVRKDVLFDQRYALLLIVTDGIDFYEKVDRRVFGPAALYAQVLKTRRNDRIVKVERRELVGATWRFEEALKNSEDSSTLNTSFIERLNLTIRQSLAYLARRTLSHARSKEKLEEHLELLRC